MVGKIESIKLLLSVLPTRQMFSGVLLQRRSQQLHLAYDLWDMTFHVATRRTLLCFVRLRFQRQSLDAHHVHPKTHKILAITWPIHSTAAINECHCRSAVSSRHMLIVGQLGKSDDAALSSRMSTRQRDDHLTVELSCSGHQVQILMRRKSRALPAS